MLELVRVQEAAWPPSLPGQTSGISPPADSGTLIGRALEGSGEPPRPWEEFAPLTLAGGDAKLPPGLAERILEQPVPYRKIVQRNLPTQGVLAGEGRNALAERLQQSLPVDPVWPHPPNTVTAHSISHVIQTESSRVRAGMARMNALTSPRLKMGNEDAARELVSLVEAELPPPEDPRFRRVRKDFESAATGTMRRLGVAREVAALLRGENRLGGLTRHMPHFVLAAFLVADPTTTSLDALAPDLAKVEIPLHLWEVDDSIKHLPDGPEKTALRNALLEFSFRP